MNSYENRSEIFIVEKLGKAGKAIFHKLIQTV